MLVVNTNQNLLGKCFLVLRRHSEVVSELSEDEWADLHQQLRIVSQALIEAFSPDHFNYAFLQNQDRHVHLHLIPRYSQVQTFAGFQFDDPDYPAHYVVPGARRSVSEDLLEKIAEEVGTHICTESEHRSL